MSVDAAVVAAQTPVEVAAEAVAGQHAAPPRRVLVVSADMGEGHNATARALEEVAGRLWPGCELRRVDTLDVMGRGVGPVFRRIYVTNVNTTPWLYEYFYRSLWRYRWFADASKRFVSGWAGRRLEPVVRGLAPDLVLSTYPLGSAGLSWLRRRGRLPVPAAAWVSDFAPHPFWVYPELDRHFVMHEEAVDVATAAVPGALVDVCGPPVVRAFRPGDRGEARAEVGLPADAFVVLVSCGAYGFGSVERAVNALLAAAPAVHVVAACGRNAALRDRLLAGGHDRDRLTVLGWVDTMPTWTRAADAVVTNAGGATALEALACERPVLMFEPIAAHGRANAELMRRSGLTLLCPAPPDLVAATRSLVADETRRSRLERAVVAHVRSHDLDSGLRAVNELRAPNRPVTAAEPVRPADALFLQIETAVAPQQVGTLLVLDRRGDGTSVTFDAIRASVRGRVHRMPILRRRLVPPATPWSPYRWVDDPDFDVDAHVTAARVDGQAQLAAVVDAFFAAPLDRRTQLWRILFVDGLPDGRAAVAVKLHHSLGDGLSVIATLLQLVDSADGPGAEIGRPDGTGAGDGPARGTEPCRRSGLAGLPVVARGLLALARSGPAPRGPLNGPLRTPERRIVTARLPVGAARLVARRIDVRQPELALGLVAEAVYRLLAARGGAAPDATLRAIVPISLRGRGAVRRHWGNWTGAVRLDLPVGPMGVVQRLQLVRDAVRRSDGAAEAAAAQFVVALVGRLPRPLHRRMARLVYRSTWFNVIVSYIPGSPRTHYLDGARLVETYPVLPLADGVALSVGLMPWSGTIGVGITADATLVPDVDRLAGALEEAFADLRRATGD